MPVPNNITDLDTNAANNSPPGTESAKGNIDNYLRQHAAFIRQLYDGKLANDANIGSSRVQGLLGKVNATTPLTKFDISADAVVLKNSAGGLVTRYNTGTITCDLSLTGSVANGRDQSAAFTANSWINLFFIWNGTTLATIASTAAATTGPTMPSGYTHWCYATTIRWNGSSNIVNAKVNGSSVTYDAAIRVLTAGVSTSFVAVAMATVAPPNALLVRINAIVECVHNLSGSSFGLYVRPTGSGSVNGIQAASTYCQVSGVTTSALNLTSVPLGTSQQLDYKLIPAAPSTSGGAYLDVVAYTVPNGDA